MSQNKQDTTMPYHADLRCSYFNGAQMNISWVYEVLKDDYNLDWEFDLKDETEYETLVDEWFKEYIAAKLFGFDPRDEYRNIESVWEMFYIKTDKYLEELRKDSERNVKMLKMSHCPKCEMNLEDDDYEMHYDAEMNLHCSYCISKCRCDLETEGACDWWERNWSNEDVCKKEYKRQLEERNKSPVEEDKPQSSDSE
jgi:hypothetical protein